MAEFPNIKSTHSLVAKHVTKEKWDKLSGIVTKTSGKYIYTSSTSRSARFVLIARSQNIFFYFSIFSFLLPSGFTLAKAIACAVEFDNQHCGIYAGDEDSYIDFGDVFNPLICEYHGLPGKLNTKKI